MARISATLWTTTSRPEGPRLIMPEAPARCSTSFAGEAAPTDRGTGRDPVLSLARRGHTRNEGNKFEINASTLVRMDRTGAKPVSSGVKPTAHGEARRITPRSDAPRTAAHHAWTAGPERALFNGAHIRHVMDNNRPPGEAAPDHTRSPRTLFNILLHQQIGATGRDPVLTLARRGHTPTASSKWPLKRNRPHEAALIFPAG